MMSATGEEERVETLHVCQCRTMSSLRSLQPVTPHVHATWDPEICLVLEEGEGDPALGFTLGSVNNLLSDSDEDSSFLPQ